MDSLGGGKPYDITEYYNMDAEAWTIAVVCSVYRMNLIVLLFVLFSCAVLDVSKANEEDWKLGAIQHHRFRHRTHHQKLRSMVPEQELPEDVVIHQLDMSCINHGLVRAPPIQHGEVVRYMRRSTSSNSKFLVAIYKCHDGHLQEKDGSSGKMYCSQGTWIGKIPKCIPVHFEIPAAPSDSHEILPSAEALKGCPQTSQCQHDCKIDEHGNPSCICFSGFVAENNNCIDIDECEDNNGRCKDICRNLPGSFECECQTGYRLMSDGKSCEDVNECLLRNSHGPCQDTCENTNGSYKCSCQNLPGTRLAQDGHSCKDVDECSEGKAGCSHTCLNTMGRAFCLCPTGLELGPDWKTCKDVNECENEEIVQACKFGCVNTIGSYHCAKESDNLLEKKSLQNMEMSSKPITEDDEDDYDEREDDDEETNEELDETGTVDGDEEENEDDYDEEPEPYENEEITTETNPPEAIEGVDKINEVLEKSDSKSENDIGGNSTPKPFEKDVAVFFTTTEVYRNTLETTEIPSETTISLEVSATVEEKHIVNNENDSAENSEDDTSDAEKEKDVQEEKINIVTTIRANLNKTNQDNEDADNYEDEYDEDYKEDDNEESENEHNEEEEEEEDEEDDDDDDEQEEKEETDENYEDLDKTVENKQENSLSKNEPSSNKMNNCSVGFKLGKNGICEDVNECYEEEVDCSDDCENTLGSYRCTCPKGYEISASDPYSCQDVNECMQNPCSHTCINEAGSFTCLCPENHQLHNKITCLAEEIKAVKTQCSHNSVLLEDDVHKCTCPEGLRLNEGDQVTCEDVDECVMEQPPCQQLCENLLGSYKCGCEKGFTLSSDGTTCEDVDECSAEKHRCSQICQNTPGAYRCACEEGFHLENDKRSCKDVDECADIGSNSCDQLCLNTMGNYECSCKEGYVLSEDGFACEDLDECELHNDVVSNLQVCTQTCINLPGSFKCACAPGYDLVDRYNCEDINECLDRNGNCTHLCANYEGSYQCACPEGYELLADERTCRTIDLCLVDNGGCSHECTLQNGQVHCSCPSGFKINEKICIQVDPCHLNNGGCSHKCENLQGKAACFCPDAHELSNDTHCVLVDPCSVDNGGCSHICQADELGSTVCDCPDSYEFINDTHCVEYNPCDYDNGGCSHTCINRRGEALCTCPDLHTLKNDTQCILIDPCETDNGGCSHICQNEQGRGVCDCPVNYEFINDTHCVEYNPCDYGNGGCSHTCTNQKGEAVCTCPELYKLSNETLCILTDPCLKNNGDCSHVCEDNKGLAKCSCPPHYEFVNDTHCIKIDACKLYNGGCSHICTLDDAGQRICNCPSDMYRLINETQCEETDPCELDNGGCSHYCGSLNGTAICSCPSGHILEQKTCRLVNPCLENNGGCSHVCDNREGRAHCECPKGYQLVDKKRCLMLNPCLENNGGCSHYCVNVNQRAHCKCPPRHELSHNGSICSPINACLINNGGCSHNCTLYRGRPKCSCPDDHTLYGKICISNDPCSINNGGCSHICSKDGLRRICSCPQGYILRPNRRNCKEINECLRRNGGCSHGCTNTKGSYTCTCPQGFILDEFQRQCVDFNECSVTNGGCEHLCTNYEGGYKCSCREGHDLNVEDLKTCQKIRRTECPLLKAPENGRIRCLRQQGLIEKSVPVETQCVVWCDKGYKLNTGPVRTCDIFGSWGAEAPVCIPVACPKLGVVIRGRLSPSSCSTGKTFPGETCKVHCRRGFRPAPGLQSFICMQNLQWSPLSKEDQVYRACVRDDLPHPFIRCPGGGQLSFSLPIGQRSMYVNIPRPETNVDWWRYVQSEPGWGMELGAWLTPGHTQIKFTAFSPTMNVSDSCHVEVIVNDEEPPKMYHCPDNMEFQLKETEHSQMVWWNEPTFTDNVGVNFHYQTKKPGHSFGSGLHHVTYIATDLAGNRAHCHFTVNIKDKEVLPTVPSSYRAVLICPGGIQYMPNTADHYDNRITSEAGCYWSHVRSKTLFSQRYRIHSRARTSSTEAAQQLRHNAFSWSAPRRRCCP